MRRGSKEVVTGDWEFKGKLTHKDVELAPLPQAAAGVGQVVQVNTGNNTAFTLPAGGTWLYFVMLDQSPGGGLYAQSYAAGVPFGIAAGGTTIVDGVSGYSWVGFAWRIA